MGVGGQVHASAGYYRQRKPISTDYVTVRATEPNWSLGRFLDNYRESNHDSLVAQPVV